MLHKITLNLSILLRNCWQKQMIFSYINIYIYKYFVGRIMLIHHIELSNYNIHIFNDLMYNLNLWFEWLHVNEEYFYRDKLGNFVIHILGERVIRDRPNYKFKTSNNC